MPASAVPFTLGIHEPLVSAETPLPAKGRFRLNPATIQIAWPVLRGDPRARAVSGATRRAAGCRLDR